MGLKILPTGFGFKVFQNAPFYTTVQAIKIFVESLDKKDQQSCLKFYEQLKKETKALMQQFNAFSKTCQQRSEACKYWDGFIEFTPMFRNLISADTEGDWEGHLHAVQDILPVFCEADCINYLRYATWYLEKMRILDQEHQDIHTEFLAGNFVVQTSVGTFKAVSPDTDLEQTINRSQKSSRGIVGQTKTESYVSEWKLVYHEILAISNCYSDLTKSKTPGF